MSTVQALIEKANSRVKSNNQRVFAKKATGAQVHENLLKSAEIAVDAYYLDPNSSNFRAAMRELKSAMTLSRRNLQA
jgi:hypothetical protein